MTTSPEISQNELANQFLIGAHHLNNVDPLASRIYRGYADFMTIPEHADWIMDLRAQKLRTGAYTYGHNIKHLHYLFHKFLFERQPDITADRFPTVAGCSQILAETYADPSAKLEAEIDHIFYNPMTTKPGRYHAALLAAGLLLPQSQDIRVVDFGSGDSSGLALMHIASNELPRRIIGEVLPSNPELTSRSHSKQNLLDAFLAKAVDRPLVQSWGLDISHPCDYTIQKYSRVCGPTKLLFDEAHKDMKTTLFAHAITSPDIHFARYDTSQPDFDHSPPIEGGVYVISDGKSYPYSNEPLPTKPVDIVTAMYMLYMHPPEQRQVIFDNMCKLGRIVLVLDAIDEVSTTPTDNPIDQLVFSKVWGDYSTNALVYDQENPELGWQSIARSKEGNFSVIRPGKLLVNGLRKASKVLTS